MSAPVWTITGKSGAATVSIELKDGQTIKGQKDSLITMSGAVAVASKMDVGLAPGLARQFFGAESLFVTTLTSSGDGTAVFGGKNAVPSGLPIIGSPGNPTFGDIELIEVTEDEPLCLSKGAFMASAEDVLITAAPQGLKQGFLGGAGFFVLRADGVGTLAIGSPGSILAFDLGEGETRGVDAGHVCAWSAKLVYDVRYIGQKPAEERSNLDNFGIYLKKTFLSQTGLMCYFTGPGKVWVRG